MNVLTNGIQDNKSQSFEVGGLIAVVNGWFCNYHFLHNVQFRKYPYSPQLIAVNFLNVGSENIVAHHDRIK